MPYEIDESDKMYLRRLCGLQEEEEVPTEVEEAYWDFKRCYDRVYTGMPLDPGTLTRIAMNYIPGKPKKEEYDPEDTVEQLHAMGEITNGDPVRAKYRNKMHDGVFLYISADGESCTVRIEDSERTIKSRNVTACKPEPV